MSGMGARNVSPGSLPKGCGARGTAATELAECGIQGAMRDHTRTGSTQLRASEAQPAPQSLEVHGEEAVA